MQTRLFASQSKPNSRQYAIWYDGEKYMVLRKLPQCEYIEHYRERRQEIFADKGNDYWLQLDIFCAPKDAEESLAEIGIDLVADRVSILSDAGELSPPQEKSFQALSTV